MIPNGKVTRVAEAIADGATVPWEETESMTADDSALVDKLRAVEQVAKAHRELPPAPGASTPRRRWGSLELLELIGEGGFGEVYRAHDSNLARDVALKLRKPAKDGQESQTDQALEEARRLARVRHSGVITIFGAEVRDGRLGIWMELIRGKTLEEVITTRGVMGSTEAATIGMDLCRALAGVHAAGLVHRDVKTMNVMREEGGRIVLMDFGSSRDFLHGGLPLVSEHVHGTPISMAPEQLRGETAGAPTDIYGLGVLLYRLLTARYPIEASKWTDLIQAHRDGRVTPLRDLRPDLPQALVQVIERAIAPDPAHRYATAGSMEAALAAVVAGSEPAKEAGEKPRGWPFWRWAALAGAGIVVVALVWVSVLRRPDFRRDDEPQVPKDSNAQQVAPPASSEPPATARVDSRSPAGSPLRSAAPVQGRTDAASVPERSDALLEQRVVLAATGQMYRERDGLRERLLTGARIRTGDLLSMTVECPREMYLYVLNEDENGSLYVLFPLPGLDTVNPLAAGASHRIPGQTGNRLIHWKVSAPGGVETVLAIGSPEPLRALERDLAAMPHASYPAPVPLANVSREAVLSLRSIGELGETDATPTVERQSRLSTALAGAANDPSARERLWIWQIQLQNPRE